MMLKIEEEQKAYERKKQKEEHKKEKIREPGTQKTKQKNSPRGLTRPAVRHRIRGRTEEEQRRNRGKKNSCARQENERVVRTKWGEESGFRWRRANC